VILVSTGWPFRSAACFHSPVVNRVHSQDVGALNDVQEKL
jgi:hypothetical protein